MSSPQVFPDSPQYDTLPLVLSLSPFLFSMVLLTTCSFVLALFACYLSPHIRHVLQEGKDLVCLVTDAITS